MNAEKTEILSLHSDRPRTHDVQYKQQNQKILAQSKPAKLQVKMQEIISTTDTCATKPTHYQNFNANIKAILKTIH